MVDRRAVPLPVGFALTVFIALTWLAAKSITEADRRGRWKLRGDERVAAPE